MAIARRKLSYPPLGQRMSVEEFLKLPEFKPYLELFEGVVTQKVSPKLPHGGLQLELGARIDQFARPRKIARAFSEARVIYAGSVVVPDLVVYRWERIPRTPGGALAEDASIPPDIIVEIASPGQSLRALRERCQWYVEHGSQIALLVNPRTQTMSVFRPDTPSHVLREADRIDLDAVLPGFQLTVQELFDTLRVD
jgi:Uma2 family endonuclease